MTLLRPHAGVLLVALALTPCVARAEPVGFSYGWTIAGGDLTPGGPGPISLSQTTAPDGSGVTVNYGGGTTTLTVATGGVGVAMPGGADFASATPAVIPLGTLTTPAPTGPAGTYAFAAPNTFTLTLTDLASGQSGALTLGGSVYGKFGPDAATLGMSASGGFGQSVTLGGHSYSVDAANPGLDAAPGGDPTTYFAQVYIDRPAPGLYPPVAYDGGGVVAAPEPSSLLLAGCALSLWGGAAMRRRRVRG